ncbi:hypothetical protein [Alcaligenes ammonioxydans]|uniref:hypothetical protein n=1 Tax=Alcaligenes ammonioxydans TaxID=2582914 RepID=UPI001C5BC983|nr:hypothetical protein [Alcaligenes ammonioxydans]
MAKETPILQTFDGGEMSPLMGGRTDLAKYFNSCSVLQNFLPLVQGPLVRRGGTQFINPVKAGRAWLLRFQVSERVSYMLEIGPYYIRFYTGRGLLAPGGVPVEVATPYSAEDLTDGNGLFTLRAVQSADTMYLFHPRHRPRKLLRTTSEQFQLQDVDFQGGPYQDLNTEKASTVLASGTTGTVTLTSSWGIFTQSMVGNIFYLESMDFSAVRPWAVYQRVNIGELRRVDMRVYQCTAVGEGNEPVTGNNTPIHTEGKAWDGDGIDVPDDQRGPIGVEWEYLHDSSGEVRITSVQSSTQATADVIRRLPNDLVPVSEIITREVRIASGQIVSSMFERYAEFTTDGPHFLSNGDTVRLLGTVVVANAGPPPVMSTIDGTYEVHQVTPTTFRVTLLLSQPALSYSPGSIAKVEHVVTVPAGGATYKWAKSLYNQDDGWPEHGAFWRQRLVLVRGRKVAMSVTGDFENFASKIGGEVETDSAIVQTLNARQINRAVWVAESDELIIGTDGDEWLIGPIQPNQAVGPANVRAERRTAYGSRAIVPVEVGGRVLFVQASGQKLRDYVFNYDTNNYASNDTTKLAEHVLRAGAIDLTYQQEPDSIIWVARADGVLVGCTYDQEPGRSDVYAWHPHPMINGWVESIETMPAPNGEGSDLWLIVRREINGQTVRYVELLRNPLGSTENPSEAFYVDCGLTYRGPEVTVISGLDHLEGQTVQALVDGAASPDRVVTNGAIELQYAGEVVHVGLPAPCAMATMGVEAGATNGTAQGKTKRLTNVIVRMHRSLGGNLGPSPDNLETLNFRRPSQRMNNPPPLYSGDSEPIPWRGGYERSAKIWYTNDQPLPVTLLALMPVVSTSDDR